MGIKKIELKDIIKDTKSSSSLDESFHLLTTAFPLKMIENDRENHMALSLSQKLIEFLNSTKTAHSGVVEYLKTLTHLIHEYESQKFKIKKSSAREMLAYLMEIHDLKQTDLAEEVGGQSVVSELLKGTREFNTKQIKALAKRFKVEPALFI
ncbi:helix-turn-helix domain-containing protein [bacterium]|nr:helix-turn-helix domain-containing protein [bacterium]